MTYEANYDAAIYTSEAAMAEFKRQWADAPSDFKRISETEAMWWWIAGRRLELQIATDKVDKLNEDLKPIGAITIEKLDEAQVSGS